jgi:Ni,Fe-hydrogenase I cytochrome b subunit
MKQRVEELNRRVRTPNVNPARMYHPVVALWLFGKFRVSFVCFAIKLDLTFRRTFLKVIINMFRYQYIIIAEGTE